MVQKLELVEALPGHKGPVTCLKVSQNNVLFSGSRDNSIMIWKGVDETLNGLMPYKALRSHGNFVSDIDLSLDNKFLLSASWDKTARIWDVTKCASTAIFVGHTNSVLSVNFSNDNRFVLTGSRDKTVKLWNTVADRKHTIEEGHSDWVTCVRHVSNCDTSFLSTGWDSTTILWNLTDKCEKNRDYVQHRGYINSMAVAPDGSLFATGCKAGTIMLFELSQDSKEEPMCVFHNKGEVHCLIFSPVRFWLTAAIGSEIKIFDLSSRRCIETISIEGSYRRPPSCLSLAWSADGNVLFAGCFDSHIRVFEVRESRVEIPDDYIDYQD